MGARGKRKANGAGAAAGPAKRRRASEQSAQSQLGNSASPPSTGAAVFDDSAAQSMVEMGFAIEDITHALEICSFSLARALLLLLNGLDAQRTKFDAQERFRRHGLKVVKSINARAWRGHLSPRSTRSGRVSYMTSTWMCWTLGSTLPKRLALASGSAWLLAWPSAPRTSSPRLCQARTLCAQRWRRCALKGCQRQWQQALAFRLKGGTPWRCEITFAMATALCW